MPIFATDYALNLQKRIMKQFLKYVLATVTGIILVMVISLMIVPVPSGELSSQKRIMPSAGNMARTASAIASTFSFSL